MRRTDFRINPQERSLEPPEDNYLEDVPMEPAEEIAASYLGKTIDAELMVKLKNEIEALVSLSAPEPGESAKDRWMDAQVAGAETPSEIAMLNDGETSYPGEGGQGEAELFGVIRDILSADGGYSIDEIDGNEIKIAIEKHDTALILAHKSEGTRPIDTSETGPWHLPGKCEGTSDARELARKLYCLDHLDENDELQLDEAAALILAEMKAVQERTIEECIDAIELDKSTFETCGRNTKGHARAIMLCKEVKERKDVYHN
jgi:hypothetical protein